MRCGLGPHGAVVAWRRDAVLKARGFSRSAADPDLDMMCRLQAAGVEGAADGSARVARAAEVFGRIDSQSLGSALLQAEQRQRAALRLLVSCLWRGTGALDARTLLLFVALDVLAPFAQVWLMVGTTLGAGVGWFEASTPLWTLVLLSFGNAAVSVVALLLRGAGSGAPATSELGRLLVASPLEFLLVRPVLAGARVLGAISIGARAD